MALAQLERRDPAFRCLFPDWQGRRPLSYFLTENLLEARRMSFFPTNGAGPDEDVNVYLARTLTRFFRAEPDPLLKPASTPLLEPPPTQWPRALRAEYYRRNADHRLLCQGLFDRGDTMRRRALFFGMDAAETRQRDRSAGAACYGLAARLLEGRPGTGSGLVEVLQKLESRYEDYLHVLAVLATRRLGLGARLSEQDLRSLWEQPPSAASGAIAPVEDAAREIGEESVPVESMDGLLDLLLEYHRAPSEALHRRLVDAAGRMGVDPQSLVA